jgi:hypothetical protein
VAIDRQGLLALYDVPDPARPGRRLPGYDRDHAARTATIVMRVAERLGLAPDLLERLEVTALLHDLGRVGMDGVLFGRIIGAAQRAGLPVRIRDMLQRYPGLSKERAAAAFLELAKPVLAQEGLAVDERVRDHVGMRMASDLRLRRVLQEKQGELDALGVKLEPWMEQVILYYYYPERMAGAPETVRLMGMVLVAAENLEAYNNRSRARDYYTHGEPSLREAFRALGRFVSQGLVSPQVYAVTRVLVLEGGLDDVLAEARGLPPGASLGDADLAFVEELGKEVG